MEPRGRCDSDWKNKIPRWATYDLIMMELRSPENKYFQRIWQIIQLGQNTFGKVWEKLTISNCVFYAHKLLKADYLWCRSFRGFGLWGQKRSLNIWVQSAKSFLLTKNQLHVLEYHHHFFTSLLANDWTIYVLQEKMMMPALRDDRYVAKTSIFGPFPSLLSL